MRALSSLIFLCAFSTVVFATAPQNPPDDQDTYRIVTISSGMVCGTALQMRHVISLQNQGVRDVETITSRVNESPLIRCDVLKIAYDQSTDIETVALTGVGDVTIVRVRVIAIYIQMALVGEGFAVMYEKRVDIMPVERYVYFQAGQS